MVNWTIKERAGQIKRYLPESMETWLSWLQEAHCASLSQQLLNTRKKKKQEWWKFYLNGAWPKLRSKIGLCRKCHVRINKVRVFFNLLNMSFISHKIKFGILNSNVKHLVVWFRDTAITSHLTTSCKRWSITEKNVEGVLDRHSHKWRRFETSRTRIH